MGRDWLAGKIWLTALFAGVLLLIGAAWSNASGASSGPNEPRSSAPGVSANEIDVGALATLSGVLSADFAPIVPGVQAYFDMVNAHGGVDGRRLVLAHVLDDGGNPTTDADLERTLVQQDHVFAVVGVATAFFNPSTFLGPSGTPTFGYATENNWSPARNLFAAYGSVLDYYDTQSEFAYVAKALHSKSAAVISYNVAQSSDECSGAVAAFRQYGIHIGYSDLSVPYGEDLSSDVVHMKQAKVDFVVSCMDVPGNIDLSRTMQQNGMTGVKQLWLDGYDQNTLRQYSSLMQGTYFLVQHVPFQAETQFPGAFPGLSLYISTMNKYEPAYTYNEVAMEGWLSAALFADGLKAAGPDLTQKKFVAATNRIRNFTGGGLATPVDWSLGHTVVTSPSCESYVSVDGDRFKVVFNKGTDVWVCFPARGRADLAHPLPPPAGSPGA